MTREIKFRAWEDGEMHYPGPVYPPYSDPTFFIGMDANNYVVGDGECKKRNDIIVMQYTGLNDRNGTPIYEGDIIQYDGKEQYEVYWSQDWAMFTVKGPQVQALMRYAEYSEVIGNIYEEA